MTYANWFIMKGMDQLVMQLKEKNKLREDPGKKIDLINGMNPEWIDLSITLDGLLGLLRPAGRDSQ